MRMQTPGVRVRQAIPGEWERVRELRLRALADAPDAFGSTLERERSFGRLEWIDWIEGWEGATNTMLVAEHGDQWIGMAVGSRTDEEDHANLYGMWVDPTCRGVGIGARLVEGVLTWARSWGARSVILGVTEINDGATGFYEHLGFVDTGERYPLREGSRLTCRTLRREP
jgi:GNAT superfamily N-acetyltransferase